MFFSGLENRLFEARLRAEFTIFPLKNISIHLFTIGPDFLSKEIRRPARGVNGYEKHIDSSIYYRARLFIEGDKAASQRREWILKYTETGKMHLFKSINRENLQRVYRGDADPI